MKRRDELVLRAETLRTQVGEMERRVARALMRGEGERARQLVLAKGELEQQLAATEYFLSRAEEVERLDRERRLGLPRGRG